MESRKQTIEGVTWTFISPPDFVKLVMEAERVPTF